MRYLLIFFIFISNLSWLTDNEKKIVIIGIAFNLKQGACLRTFKNELYYIENLTDWDSKFVNKKVKVSGILYLRVVNVDTSAPPVQNVSGEFKMIRNAKWTLFKK